MQWLWACWLAAALAARVGGAAGVAQTRETVAGVRTAVLQALIADPKLGRYPLDASVGADGRVVLHGALPTKRDKDRASHVVQRVAGVHEVENRIAVNAAALPLAGAAAAPARSAEPATAASSADVQAAILNALAAKPGMGQVTVTVRQAQVTLGGRADSPHAKDEAGEIARANADGRKLENDIRVPRRERH